MRVPRLPQWIILLTLAEVAARTAQLPVQDKRSKKEERTRVLQLPVSAAGRHHGQCAAACPPHTRFRWPSLGVLRASTVELPARRHRSSRSRQPTVGFPQIEFLVLELRPEQILRVRFEVERR